MSVLSAVEKTLIEASTPLGYREITRRIIERGLWKTEGKTPDATVKAELAVDIKRYGPDSRFQRAGKGVFALRAWGLPEYFPKHAAASTKPGKTTIRAIPVKTLSFSDAAEQVLEQYGNKKPMHYRDITAKAIDLGLIHTAGQTPAATLYALILTEIARKTRRGLAPRFIRHGKGFVGLSRWMARGLAFQIEQHNAGVRKKLRSNLGAMPPAEFEALIGQLLVKIGFEDVTVTNPNADGGIDVRGTLVVGDVIKIRMAVQVKRWKRNVQSTVVQQVRGSLGTHEQGLIVTTSDFSPGARKEAERPDATPVALMNGEQLATLLVANDIGVRRTSYDLIELGEVDEE